MYLVGHLHLVPSFSSTSVSAYECECKMHGYEHILSFLQQFQWKPFGATLQKSDLQP